MKVCAVLLLISGALAAQTADYIRQVQAKHAEDPRQRVWSRVSGNGLSASLGSSGSGKVLTFTRCPAGVAVGDYVRISEGVGTAESAVVTAVSCTPATAGTITVTTAATHTGSFRIGTATAGVQEAVNIASSNGTLAATVGVPSGTYNFYAPVLIRGGKTAITGAGRGVSRIVQNHASHSAFVFSGTGTQTENTIKGLAIVQPGGKTSGWAIEAIDQYYFIMNDLQIDSIPSGVLLQDSKSVWFTDSAIRSFLAGAGIGIKITGTALGTDNYYFRSLEILGGGGLLSTAAACINIVTGGGFFFTDVTAYDCGTGLLVNPTGAAGNEVRWGFVNGSNFDSSLVNGIRFEPADATVKSWSFTNTWVGSNAGDGINFTASGTGSIAGLNFDGIRIFNNGFNGATFSTGTGDVRINGAKVAGNSTAAPGVHAGLQFSNGIDNFSVVGSHIGPYDSFVGAQGRGIYISAAGSNNYTVAHNTVTGNSVNIEDAGTGTTKVFEGNLVPNADRAATVASAASITLPARNEHLITITGTTAIQTMGPVWGGRKVKLIFNNAAPGGVATGGTAGSDFVKVVSATQNIPLECEYAVSQWYCN